MRIGIVNDVAIAVEALRRALAATPEHRVIWVAENGTEAVDRCATDTPDLVLMDLVMPGMNGVEATRRIMASTPCAILVVTVSVGANVGRVYEAMGHGALDAFDTPALGVGTAAQGAAPLLAKIDAIARLISDRAGGWQRTDQGEKSARLTRRGRQLVAIGASAGGPAALSTLLRGLPRDFPAAIVVIQHVDEHFAAGMADWLNKHSALPVRLAAECDCPTVGTVLLAGTNDHLTLTAIGGLGYTPDPRDYVYRPSVDVFFESVSRLWPGRAVGVLLTGMGSDGARGLKALRDKGHHTIAQDQASSAVYGMPKAAAALGAAVDILALERIAPRLVATVACSG
jgi:two-component system, chemotaxis family, response regulator WspF